MSGSIHAPGTGVNEFQPYKKIPTEGKDTWEATSDSTSSGRDWDTMVTEFEKSIFSFAKDDLESDSEAPNGGSISLGEIAGHFTKGIGLTFTSMLKHWGQSLGFSLAFGTLLTFAPTLAVPLAAGGTILGGLKMIGAAAKIVASDTKRDTRLAWQSMGSGLLTFLPSFIGCKAAVKTAGKYGVELSKPADELGAWGSFKECCKLSVGIKPAGSKGILDIAKTTSLSKLKDIFLISESKAGNGNLMRRIEDAKTKLKNKQTQAENDIESKESTGPDNYLDKERTAAAKKRAYESIDEEIQINNEEITRLRKELEDLPGSPTEFQNRIQQKIDKLNDVNTNLQREERELLDLNSSGEVHQAFAITGNNNAATRIRNTVQFNQTQISNLQARRNNYDSEVKTARTELRRKITQLTNANNTLSDSRTSAKLDADNAAKAAAKAKEKVDKARKTLETIKNELKNLERLTEDNPDFARLMKELRNCEDNIIFSSAERDWEYTLNDQLMNHSENQMIIGPESNRSTFRTNITGGNIKDATGALLNRTLISSTAKADARCVFGSLENIDAFIKNYRAKNPKVNFWSANTPFWDGLFTTTKGYALFGAGIGDKRHE